MLCFPGMTSLGGFYCIIGRCKYMTTNLLVCFEMEIIIDDDKEKYATIP